MHSLEKVNSHILILLLLFNALGFVGYLLAPFKTANDLVERLDNQQYLEEENCYLMKCP
jgi:hypothetical protein